MASTQNRRLVPRRKAAHYLGMSAAALKARHQRGTIDLPYVVIHNRIFYEQHELDRFVERHRVEPATTK